MAMDASGSNHDTDKADVPAGTGEAKDDDARELEALGQMLRRGKAAIFVDHRDRREESADCGEQARRALAAARQASRPRRLRFPTMAIGTCVAAAAALLVIWIGVLPRDAGLSGVTVANFVSTDSDIAPPLLRSGDADSVDNWLQAAQRGVAAVRGADQVRVAEPGRSVGPSPEFLRNVKTPTLLTLEEVEQGGEKCLAVRLYSTKTGKMLAENLVFPAEEDNAGAAVEKAAKELARRADS